MDAVAEMGNHQAAVVAGQPEKRMRLRGHVAVRGAVEAVAAHAQLFKIAVRQSVQIRLRRQRQVEAGIKYRDLLHAREQALCRFHAAQVGVVMQRCQRGDWRICAIASSVIRVDSLKRFPRAQCGGQLRPRCSSGYASPARGDGSQRPFVVW